MACLLHMRSFLHSLPLTLSTLCLSGKNTKNSKLLSVRKNGTSVALFLQMNWFTFQWLIYRDRLFKITFSTTGKLTNLTGTFKGIVIEICLKGIIFLSGLTLISSNFWSILSKKVAFSRKLDFQPFITFPYYFMFKLWQMYTFLRWEKWRYYYLNNLEFNYQ